MITLTEKEQATVFILNSKARIQALVENEGLYPDQLEKIIKRLQGVYDKKEKARLEREDRLVKATNFAQRLNIELSPLEIQSLILLFQGTK